MIGRSIPFSKWAASMKHEPAAGGQSVMIYTYTIETGPAMLRWLMEPKRGSAAIMAPITTH